MCKLTDEIKAKNYELFKKKVSEIGIDPNKIDEYFGDKLINAPYTIEKFNILADEGTLLNTVLRVLTPLALKLNEILPENMRYAKDTIVKICLLQHMAKAFMFLPNDNEWEVSKGKKFKFSDKKIALRQGARSLAIALELGVPMNENEIEALTIIDKNGDDEQAKYFATPLGVIIRQANELTNTISLFSKNESN